MIDPDSGQRAHLDILAERLCVAYYADNIGDEQAKAVWPALSPISKGQWRRAARQATKELTGAYP